ncbi:hypothetical protein N7532_000476 [Penicillium argentinense]|uniref:Uncharacterized protein n=1 Tax=Penicillium argentinense TaxID=1131581 RepID=A0A9W9G5L0_9EURO|nr:uncharacterized protein N7532_000476 [Penicillium argentinense]KAJ5112431.1 hypothetical protein N7532_000476 [Penicillium argentinense]
MNRFRKHKKNKEVKDTLEELEGGSTTTTSSSPFSLKPSKKKEAREPKPELDFAAALPPTDDFRTSLLMPKLSARFSMLREQDDPESKMGKASDDSVLFPKRASRLNLFGHNPNILTDIDEVSSNDGSRPSIALGRTDSYASGADIGYGTDDDRPQSGSIMSRARRADGNNLFGGRQKVYRIPVRAGGAPSPSSPGGMGKAVYEHDLNLSAFQKMRRKEKEEQAAAEESAREYAAHEYEDTISTNSSINRTTYSSIASGPTVNTRTSTAATSIDENQLGSSQGQPPNNAIPEAPVEAGPPSAMSTPRNGSVRSRRLYGQGLTQTAQNQQNSTLYRLESLSRQRAGTPDSLSLNRNYSRSATNLRDRLQKLAIAEPASTSRPTSPPSSATSPKQPTIPEPAPRDRISPTAASFGAAPPLSPPSSETDDGASLLAAALNPEDHGKATAMGLFNRPATGFDEQAFSRRQLQMHQGRATPPPRRPSPPRRAPPQEPASRSRGLSKSSYRSRAESASSHYSSDAHHGMDQSRDASPSRPGVSATFYANSTASESGDEGEDRRSYEVSSATSLATEYGQFYQSNTATKPPTPNGEQLETLPEVRYSDLGDLKPIEENDPEETNASDKAQDNEPPRPDSPVIQAGFGLGGIRSHLRQESDKSSIFPPPSPGLPQQEMNSSKDAPQDPVPEDIPTPPTEEKLPAEAFPEPVQQPETSSPRAPSRHSSDVSVERSSEDSSDNGTFGKVPSWREELAYHHRRDGSTETQKEREEFAIELAERRKKVQEKLRSVAESESRSSSPTFGRSTPDLSAGPKAGNAFSILKHKSGKQGLGKPDQKSLYGYNSSSTPALVEESWRHEERPGFSFGPGRYANSSPHVPTERSFRSRMPTISRGSHEESRESSRSRGVSPQPSFRTQRDRSGSDGSGRSKSRSRYRERDDLQTVDEGSVIAHENFVMPDNFEPPVPATAPGSRRPSVEMTEPFVYDRSSSAASGRYRSASRSGSGNPNFQYERPFHFNQAAHPPSIIGASPRPSPATPAYSANATPPLHDVPPEQSPASALASATNSGGNPLPQRTPGHTMLQKRTINKKLISEPTFVSSTSNVPTVGLPPGAIPSNGAPPLPPMNPRRRRGTQTIMSAFRTDKHDSSRAASPAPSLGEEHTSFMEDEKRPPSRNRLRKTSSAGGSLNARARQEAMAGPAPAVPQYPPPAIPVDGGMF